MRQQVKALSKIGPKENLLFVNFEDPRFIHLYVKLLSEIHEAYLEFLSPKGTIFVFLDEVQEVEGWEKWVRSAHELGKARIDTSEVLRSRSREPVTESMTFVPQPFL